MTVRVKFFAIARDLSGLVERDLELVDGATVADALAALVAATPALEPFVGRLAVAVNLEYAKRTGTLKDGDEVAIIPPVSGG